MKLTLKNTQYEDFVMYHVLRPYKTFLGYEHRITSDMFEDAYLRILEIGAKNSDWINLIFDRLSRIYGKIDFSFFPNDATANFIKENLIKRGVLSI